MRRKERFESRQLCFIFKGTWTKDKWRTLMQIIKFEALAGQSSRSEQGMDSLQPKLVLRARDGDLELTSQ